VICLFEELKLKRAWANGRERGKGHTGVRQPDLFRWLVSFCSADYITRWDFMAAVENYSSGISEYRSISV